MCKPKTREEALLDLLHSTKIYRVVEWGVPSTCPLCLYCDEDCKRCRKEFAFLWKNAGDWRYNITSCLDIKFGGQEFRDIPHRPKFPTRKNCLFFWGLRRALKKELKRIGK